LLAVVGLVWFWSVDPAALNRVEAVGSQLVGAGSLSAADTDTGLEIEQEQAAHLSEVYQETTHEFDQGFKSFFKLVEKKREGKYNKETNIPSYLDKDGF